MYMIDGMAIVELRDDIRYIRRLFQYLTENERYVLYHRFGLNHTEQKTLDELAKELHQSKENIRQTQARALRKLRLKFDNTQTKENKNERKCKSIHLTETSSGRAVVARAIRDIYDNIEHYHPELMSYDDVTDMLRWKKYRNYWYGN